MGIKKVSSIGFVCLFALTSYAQAANVTMDKHSKLRVVNNWFQPVKVKEGYWSVKEDYAYAGRTIEWEMMTGKITNLVISYNRGGVWMQIPGCPYGSYNHGMTVSISPSHWDPNTPVCKQK